MLYLILFVNISFAQIIDYPACNIEIEYCDYEEDYSDNSYTNDSYEYDLEEEQLESDN